MGLLWGAVVANLGVIEIIIIRSLMGHCLIWGAQLRVCHRAGGPRRCRDLTLASSLHLQEVRNVKIYLLFRNQQS